MRGILLNRLDEFRKLIFVPSLQMLLDEAVHPVLSLVLGSEVWVQIKVLLLRLFERREGPMTWD